MGKYSVNFLKVVIGLLFFYVSISSAQIAIGGRRGPAGSGPKTVPNMPIVESSNFICSKDGQVFECDKNGQPISHLPGGGVTRQQLINECLKTSSSQAVCEASADNEAPYNAIPISRNNNTDISNYDEECRINNMGFANPAEVDALCRSQASGNSSSKGVQTEKREAATATGTSCDNGVLVDDGLGKSVCQPKPASAANKDESPANQANTEEPPYNLNLCEQAQVDANSACDSESKNWVRTINQVSGLLGSQLNQGACSTLAAAQAGSAASLTMFSMQCGQAVESCLTQCRNVATKTKVSTLPEDKYAHDTANAAIKECSSKGASAKKTEQDVGSGIQQIAQAVQSCRASFGTAAFDTNGQLPAYTAKPDADILAGLQPRNDQGLVHEGVGGGGMTGDRGANLDLSDLVDDTPTTVAAKPRGIGQDPGGQQGSAGIGGGGGVGVDASSGRAANRKGNTGLLSNILSGFFGSGGGGLFGGGRASTGNRDAGGGQYAAQPAGSKGPDLRQFLPGAKLDPKKDRGIAGRIVSKDGLIGPHGNLWRDVSNRYQVKRASLLP